MRMPASTNEKAARSTMRHGAEERPWGREAYFRYVRERMGIEARNQPFQANDLLDVSFAIGEAELKLLQCRDKLPLEVGSLG